MILSFTPTINNHPSFFHGKLTGKIDPLKIHTFRIGDRWKPGDKIHFWMGRPDRPRTNPMPLTMPVDLVHYWTNQHKTRTVHSSEVVKYPDFRDHWTPCCYGIENFRLTIEQNYNQTGLHFALIIGMGPHWQGTLFKEDILINEQGESVQKYRMFYPDTMDNHKSGYSFDDIAANDGLSAEDFILYFWSRRKTKASNKVKHVGQIIHWTEGAFYSPNEGLI